MIAKLNAAVFCGVLLIAFSGHGFAQSGDNRAPARLTTVSGGVQFRPAQKEDWFTAPAGQLLFENDRVRTLADGRATVELRDLSQLRLNPRSELVVTPSRAGSTKGKIDIVRGLFYFLHRDDTKGLEVNTPVGTAAIEGTEFVLSVAENGTTLLTLVDGRVRLSNDLGQTDLASGEQGVIEPNQAPRKTAVVHVQKEVQWSLYYPGVLDPDELGLPQEGPFSASLQDYREGDILGAIASYPTNRQPASVEERLFFAGLLLSSGRATNYDAIISPQDESHRLARALRTMIAAVQKTASTNVEPVVPGSRVRGNRREEAHVEPETRRSEGSQSLLTSAATSDGLAASEWLALSYYRQGMNNLDGALEAARNAVKRSANFGFAWERVAELEFSFGRIRGARQALDRALALSPRNAQAHALSGFLHLARNQVPEANTAFDKAIALDPMLANAFLGRGLARILRGQNTEGRTDLQTAATLEPTRWILRSYLGKAYAHEARFGPGTAAIAGGSRITRAHLQDLAEKELELAMTQDPLDPTAWLYSALLHHDEYRTSEAIRDLEESARLNENRQVYRSKLLLDQDQAVRSANLAQIFSDAGMNEVSVRESARAVSFDYANYSAHLNLASSYNALRDPTRFNLRYESQWFNEHLLASMLSPVGAGSLSQNLSQEEYSRMFGAKRFGLNGTTEYFSNGEVRQLASQFGTFDHTSYALDLDYQHKDGIRPNNDLSRIEWYSRIKQEITAQDSLLILTKYQDYEAGDNFQYYDPDASARPDFRFTETQTPLLLGGWHREWSPGVHTLLFGGRLENEQHFSDRSIPQQFQSIDPPGDPFNFPLDIEYQNKFVIYSAEVNQIFQRERQTDILGVRYQHGDFEADSRFDSPDMLFGFPIDSSIDVPSERFSAYLYHHWEVVDGLMLIGGVAFDDLSYPANYRRPPLQDTEADQQKVSPKAGMIWQVSSNITVRGIYSRELGGISYDESVRLEPTQIAGFAQSFRTLISESLVGSVEAPEYEIAGGALDLKLAPRSWLTLQAQTVQEEVDRSFGVFSFELPNISPAATRELLDFRETSTGATFNQILGQDWFLQAQYQFSRSDLRTEWPDIAATPGYERSADDRADLHQFRFAAEWKPRNGFFTRGELWWFIQKLDGSNAQPPGDEFPQLNLYAGYRFPNRRGELTLGLLNATGEDYRLSPLSYYNELPRERLFYLRFRFNL